MRSGRVPGRIFLTPAGAALILVSFFLPWARCSCAPGVAKSVTGACLGGLLWAIPIGAAGMLVAFALLYRARRWGWLRQVVALATLTGLGALLVRSIQLSAGTSTPFGRITPEDLNAKTQFGAFGTVVGYLAAVAGVTELRRLRRRRAPAGSGAPERPRGGR